MIVDTRFLANFKYREIYRNAIHRLFNQLVQYSSVGEHQTIDTINLFFQGTKKMYDKILSMWTNIETKDIFSYYFLLKKEKINYILVVF